MNESYKNVKEILDKRKLVLPEDKIEVYELAFSFALKSEEDAMALVEFPNRVLQWGESVAKEIVCEIYLRYKDNVLFKESFKKNVNQKIVQLIESKETNGQLLADEIPRSERTLNMKRYNPKIFEEKDSLIYHAKTGSFLPVTRLSRNFNWPLVCAGSGGREDVLLDISSPILKNSYEEVLSLLRPDFHLVTLLGLVSSHTKKIFKQSGIGDIEKNTLVPLSYFIERGAGECRHHALLNAYLISRLRKERPDLSDADIIFHRQAFKKNAHAWNIVKCKDGTIFNVDSTRRAGVFRLIKDTPIQLDSFYEKGVYDLIVERYIPEWKKEEVNQQGESIKIMQEPLKKELEKDIRLSQNPNAFLSKPFNELLNDFVQDGSGEILKNSLS